MRSFFITALKKDGEYGLYMDGKKVGDIKDLRLSSSDDLQTLYIHAHVENEFKVEVKKDENGEETEI